MKNAINVFNLCLILYAALPIGWTKEFDETGTPVFFEKETGKRTLHDPRLAFATETKTSLYDFKQRFDASSSALEVLHGVDLRGKTAVITGANCGIGKDCI